MLKLSEINEMSQLLKYLKYIILNKTSVNISGITMNENRANYIARYYISMSIPEKRVWRKILKEEGGEKFLYNTLNFFYQK